MCNNIHLAWPVMQHNIVAVVAVPTTTVVARRLSEWPDRPKNGEHRVSANVKKRTVELGSGCCRQRRPATDGGSWIINNIIIHNCNLFWKKHTVINVSIAHFDAKRYLLTVFLFICPDSVDSDMPNSFALLHFQH